LKTPPKLEKSENSDNNQKIVRNIIPLHLPPSSPHSNNNQITHLSLSPKNSK